MSDQDPGTPLITGHLTGETRELSVRLHDEGPPFGTARFSIYGDDGALLFALYGDGSVTCPNEARIPEAARMFWREVRRLAHQTAHPTEPRTP